MSIMTKCIKNANNETILARHASSQAHVPSFAFIIDIEYWFNVFTNAVKIIAVSKGLEFIYILFVSVYLLVAAMKQFTLSSLHVPSQRTEIRRHAWVYV